MKPLSKQPQKLNHYVGLIGTAGSAVAAARHCGVTFTHRLRQEEQQLHPHSAVPDRISPVLSPGAAGQGLCKATIAVSLLLPFLARSSSSAQPGAEAGRRKGTRSCPGTAGSALLRMKVDP